MIDFVNYSLNSDKVDMRLRKKANLPYCKVQKLMETRRRSLLKALIWNAIGLATMGGVGFIATGSLAVGGKMALVNTAVGLSLYLVYERIWANIGWGRKTP